MRTTQYGVEGIPTKGVSINEITIGNLGISNHEEEPTYIGPPQRTCVLVVTLHPSKIITVEDWEVFRTPLFSGHSSRINSLQ